MKTKLSLYIAYSSVDRRAVKSYYIHICIMSRLITLILYGINYKVLISNKLIGCGLLRKLISSSSYVIYKNYFSLVKEDVIEPILTFGCEKLVWEIIKIGEIFRKLDVYGLYKETLLKELENEDKTKIRKQ